MLRHLHLVLLAAATAGRRNSPECSLQCTAAPPGFTSSSWPACDGRDGVSADAIGYLVGASAAGCGDACAGLPACRGFLWNNSPTQPRQWGCVLTTAEDWCGFGGEHQAANGTLCAASTCFFQRVASSRAPSFADGQQEAATNGDAEQCAGWHQLYSHAVQQEDASAQQKEKLLHEAVEALAACVRLTPADWSFHYNRVRNPAVSSPPGWAWAPTSRPR